MSTKTTKATKPAPTRAARRTPEQIAKDDVAMTEKKLALANARLERLRSETRKADYEASALARLLVYQSSHPLLTQEALDLEGGS